MPDETLTVDELRRLATCADGRAALLDDRSNPNVYELDPDTADLLVALAAALRVAAEMLAVRFDRCEVCSAPYATSCPACGAMSHPQAGPGVRAVVAPPSVEHCCPGAAGYIASMDGDRPCPACDAASSDGAVTP